jgi:hypothetical protein
MDESIFTTSSFVRKFRNYTEPHYLLPFGDIHRDSKNCHVELWNEWCDWAKHKPRSCFIGMGDYFDNFSTSERMGLDSAHLHESTKENFDDFCREKVKSFSDEIGFMRGKLLGMIEGNHYYPFSDGTTSTQYLCQLMRCKYLGVASIVRITFKYLNGNKCSSVDIFAYHGKGAARLVGGSLNTVQQMSECAEANIYLMGHDHKKSIGMSSKLRLTDGRTGIHLNEKKQLYARTGSFLMGYCENRPSYVVKKLLNPTDLGTVKIELTPKLKSKTVEGKEVSERLVIDIHASL